MGKILEEHTRTLIKRTVEKVRELEETMEQFGFKLETADISIVEKPIANTLVFSEDDNTYYYIVGDMFGRKPITVVIMHQYFKDNDMWKLRRTSWWGERFRILDERDHKELAEKINSMSMKKTTIKQTIRPPREPIPVNKIVEKMNIKTPITPIEEEKISIAENWVLVRFNVYGTIIRFDKLNIELHYPSHLRLSVIKPIVDKIAQHERPRLVRDIQRKRFQLVIGLGLLQKHIM